MQYHRYNLYDIENMMPWERQIYIELLKAHIKEEEEKARDRAAQNKRRR
jgi:hypothetical protein